MRSQSCGVDQGSKEKEKEMNERLKFKAKEVQSVIDYTIKHPLPEGGWRIPYQDKQSPRPTLLMVGDHGVYIMTGGAKPKGKKVGEEQGWPVAYAEGCNPDVDEFDDWWALKGATWGNDDGSIHWDAGEVGKMLRATFAADNGYEWESAKHLISEFSKQSITLRPHP